MKLEIKRRLNSAWVGVKAAGRGVAHVVTPDRESLVVRRKGKHLRIRNGVGKADITFQSLDRAKEATRAIIDPAEVAINDAHLALTSK